MRPPRLPAAVTAMLAAPLAAAADAPAAAPMPGSGAAAIQVAFSLLVVLALVVVLAWAARKLRFAPRRTAGDMRILAEMVVGPRERLLLLQVGDRQALVGVSGSGIHPLQLLAEDVTLKPAAGAGGGALAGRVRAMLERGGQG